MLAWENSSKLRDIFARLNIHVEPYTWVKVWNSTMSIIRFELSCVYEALFLFKLSNSYRPGILHIPYHNEVFKSGNVLQYDDKSCY